MSVPAMMRDAAGVLRGRVEGGAFTALDAGHQSDLRELAMSLSGWADLVETFMANRQDALGGKFARDMTVAELISLALALGCKWNAK